MAAPAQDKLSASELAEQYGWAAAVLNSDKELRGLFNQAVSGQWSEERFTAKLRATKWYRRSSERWRQTEMLYRTDPATYKSQWNQAKSEILASAGAMGATVTGRTLTNLVNSYYRQGWNELQLRDALSKYITVKDGVMKGAAGQAAEALRGIAYANGVRYNDDWYVNAARNVASGQGTVEAWESEIRKQAASAFPVFAEQIKAGQNVSDIASPYQQTMGALLELNPNEIDLFDPTIRKALAGRDPKTGTPTAKSLWEFENDLRGDSRWLQTNNARDTTMATANAVLSAFGFGG